jgi:hypothetical protein
MSRNLDTSLATALSNRNIQPAIFANLTFKSGVMHVWSGVGDFVWNGNTYTGVGYLGKLSPITEGSDVEAQGMEVALTGIGLSPFPPEIPPVPTDTNPLPVAPAPGEFTTIAWPVTGNASFSPGYNTAEAFSGEHARCDAEQYAGGHFGGTAFATLTDFIVPPLPADAVITQAYLTGTYIQEGGPINQHTPNVTPGPFAIALTTPDVAHIKSSIAQVFTQDTLVPPGGGIFYGVLSTPNTGTFSSVGVIVYYTTANNAYSIIQEALADFQAGAPAQIYFGLLSNGALIGNPYLVFSGQVDQPTIDMSAQSATITLALENKLSNLLRPTGRRYTATDQKLKYPDDSGFNWVEILNDVALRWGS